MAGSSVLSLILAAGVICALCCPTIADYGVQQAGQNNDNNDTCKHCVAFFEDVAVVLKNETVEERIVTELVKVCKILGWADCVDYVHEYGVLFMSYLADIWEPKELCKGFCKKEKITPKDGQLAKPNQKSTRNPCADCEAFMADLGNTLHNRTLKKMAVEKLEKVCESLKWSKCADYVDDYGMAALKYLEDHFVPKNVCTSMTFCTGSANLQRKQIPSTNKVFRVL